MKTGSWKLLPLLLLPLALIAGCPSGEEEAAEKEEKARPVRGADVGTADLVHHVEVIGELQGKEEVRVFAQVPERIKRLEVSEGQTVKQGQLIAVLRGDLQADGVRQAEAGLEAVRASVGALKDQVRRAKALVEAGTLPRSQLEGLESQLRASEAQERQLEAGVSAATSQRNMTMIRAPITGTIAGLTLQEGDMVAPTMPLLTIVDASSLVLKLRVPERDFLRVRPEMPVTVSPLAANEVSVSASVTMTGPVVDRMSRTGLVEIDIPDAEHRLVPGSAVRVRIEISRRPDVIQVPAAAVILTPATERTGEALAFVIEDGTARKKTIRVGERQGDDLEVIEGLAVGERLVVSGAHLLREGQAVEDVAAKSAAAAGEREAS
ncbi:MAG: efflux RND transporter periplasmic adaptor subunit [Deltaproteobacteria bacterium]|nr:efflux RND transporter periplasmic adaptor subunit [Deltaproteobacteria bacterium]